MKKKKPIQWAYGITTVPGRLNELFPRTLASLAKAGFDNPWIFVDGGESKEPYERFGPLVNLRSPAVGVAGNWLLSMWELYLRNPTADRFILFQDDIVACCNLRVYLEQCELSDMGYYNLITYPDNEKLIEEKPDGWHQSNQRGRGGQGLMFSREMVYVLLSQRHLLERARDPRRGKRLIDGGISHAMRSQHRLEYVHKPSLLCHTGTISVSRNHPQPAIRSFPGEDYDPLTILQRSE